MCSMGGACLSPHPPCPSFSTFGWGPPQHGAVFAVASLGGRVVLCAALGGAAMLKRAAGRLVPDPCPPLASLRRRALPQTTALFLEPPFTSDLSLEA